LPLLPAVFSSGGNAKSSRLFVQKRFITNLLLLLIVAILIFFFFASEEPLPGNKKITLLSNIETSTVNSITIHRNNRDRLVFRRQDGFWIMVSPIRTRAHASRIDAMLQLAESRSFARIEVKDETLSHYKLDPPVLGLDLGTHEFFFGTTDPLDERRYVLFNNTIHLVNDNLFYQLSQSPTFFISTRLVPEDQTIESIQFENYLLFKSQTNWRIKPQDNNINTEQIQKLAQTWQNQEARQVLSYEAGNVEEKITIIFTSGQTIQFDLISKAQELVLGRADLALRYHLDADMSERMFIQQDPARE
jgi:hypothetical protein